MIVNNVFFKSSRRARRFARQRAINEEGGVRETV